MAELESFDQVDVSAVDELIHLQRQREVVQERLAKVEERRQGVSEEVFERVSLDYQGQVSALERESQVPLSRSRAEYAKLIELYGEVRAALDEIALDKEELELRSEIGEFTPQAFKKLMSGCRKKLRHRRAEIAAGDELRAKFESALPAAEQPPARALSREVAPPAGAVADVEHRATVAAGQVPSVPDGVTVLMPQAALGSSSPPGAATATASPPGAPGGATVILQRARLVATGEQTDKEYPLGLEGTLVGSSSECDLVLDNEAISARHARLSFRAGGYTLLDLESSSGTVVNGERVQERVLQDGDLIRVGDLEFHFRLG